MIIKIQLATLLIALLPILVSGNDRKPTDLSQDEVKKLRLKKVFETSNGVVYVYDGQTLVSYFKGSGWSVDKLQGIRVSKITSQKGTDEYDDAYAARKSFETILTNQNEHFKELYGDIVVPEKEDLTYFSWQAVRRVRFIKISQLSDKEIPVFESVLILNGVSIADFQVDYGYATAEENSEIVVKQCNGSNEGTKAVSEVGQDEWPSLTAPGIQVSKVKALTKSMSAMSYADRLKRTK